MRFQLPQFIETEIKLIGPLTLKQFLWIAGGAALLFVSFMILGFSTLFFMIAVPVVGLALALAFVRVQEMPLINFLAYALGYLINPKKFVYQKSRETTVRVPKQTQ